MASRGREGATQAGKGECLCDDESLGLSTVPARFRACQGSADRLQATGAEYRTDMALTSPGRASGECLSSLTHTTVLPGWPLDFRTSPPPFPPHSSFAW